MYYDESIKVDFEIPEFLQKKLALGDALWYTTIWLCGESCRADFTRKEVNKSNEGRYPSQLSADYDQMRLR